MKNFIFITYEKEGVCRLRIAEVYRGVKSYWYDDIDPCESDCIKTREFVESVIYQQHNLTPDSYNLSHKTETQIRRENGGENPKYKNGDTLYGVYSKEKYTFVSSDPKHNDCLICYDQNDLLVRVMAEFISREEIIEYDGNNYIKSEFEAAINSLTKISMNRG